MKKFNQSLLFVLCMASTQVHASDIYFSVSDGDTLRISPSCLNWYVAVPIVAEFDNGVADHFRFELTHSTSLELIDAHTGNDVAASDYGINIPYIKSDGTSGLFCPTITTIKNEEIVDIDTRQTIYECSTTVYGYWDYNNDGTYEPYGLVKWGPGHYDRMFNLEFRVKNDCTGDSIIIDGLITSTYDTRYPTSVIYNYPFHRVVHLVMTYLLGDVDGNDVVNIDDATALNDYLLGISSLNQYQLDAADVDHNGIINIDDVTELIDMLINV